MNVKRRKGEYDEKNMFMASCYGSVCGGSCSCGPREAQGDETIKDNGREGRNQYPGGCPDCRFERTTAMGMVKLMDDVDKGEVKSENYSFKSLLPRMK